MPDGEHLPALDIPRLNRRFEGAAPRAILEWAWHTFGEGLVASSSFQTQSLPLLHFISIAAPRVPVIFVDTGFHFPETLTYRDELVSRFGLNLEIIRPEIYGEAFTATFGDLYQRSPDACCFYNKVVPFNVRLRQAKAWISGIRRDQMESRRDTALIEIHPTLPLVKINPLAGWTAAAVSAYIDRHYLPRHPLSAHGYRSIGCQPCTAPSLANEDERTGRWPGQEKCDCGLHT